uniref:RxLR effector candidate protein n=1 Tax=Peronospora matthiolae TaxID=2874970 RepID=A0AAV1VM05_9STRA
MRPHFAVALLAVSLVATMDKAERLRRPSSPPNRKSGDDSAQGHVRGALTTDEERGANTLFLNAAASQVSHLRERGQLVAWFQPQEAVKGTMGDQELLRFWENYLNLGKADNFRGIQELVEVDGLLGFASTIARLKRGSESVKAIASRMEKRLFYMWLCQGTTPELLSNELKLDIDDVLLITPAFAMLKSYEKFLAISDLQEIQAANLLTYKRPVSDELNDLRLPSDADNDLRLLSEREHDFDNNPRKRERESDDDLRILSEHEHESDNNPRKRGRGFDVNPSKRMRGFDENPSKRMRESDDNLSKRMRESDDNLSKRMRGLIV